MMVVYHIKVRGNCGIRIQRLLAKVFVVMSKASCSLLAERMGFEPTVRLPAHTLSKRAPSTTRTPLLKGASGARVLSALVGPKVQIDYTREL
jgi:hypothetical protein